MGAAAFPSSAGVATAHVDGGGSHAEGSVFQYRFVYIDSSGTESMPTDAISVVAGVARRAQNGFVRSYALSLLGGALIVALALLAVNLA